MPLPPFARALLLLSLLVLAIPARAAADAAPATPRQVKLALYILDIMEIDEPAGQFSAHVLLGAYWQDPALAFEGTKPQVWREDAAIAQANSMWRPMVEFSRTVQPADLEHALLRIHPDGRVEFERQMDIRVATDLDLRKLPFDTQHLQLELESFQHHADAVEFTLAPTDLRMAKHLSLPHWHPGKVTGSASAYFSEIYEENYSRVLVTIDLARRFEFYLWQMIVPLAILIGMAFAVFFLPPTDLADRMNVIIASLLTVVALSYSLHTDLPKIPYLTVIDWLFLLAYVFLALAMAGMVWIRKLHDRDEAKAVRLDRWLRWAYPIAYLLSAGTVVVAANL